MHLDRFARRFLDAREVEGDARSLMNLHNNKAGRKVRNRALYITNTNTMKHRIIFTIIIIKVKPLACASSMKLIESRSCQRSANSINPTSRPKSKQINQNRACI